MKKHLTFPVVLTAAVGFACGALAESPTLGKSTIADPQLMDRELVELSGNVVDKGIKTVTIENGASHFVVRLPDDQQWYEIFEKDAINYLVGPKEPHFQAAAGLQGRIFCHRPSLDSRYKKIHLRIFLRLKPMAMARTLI
jgi:hypothetical protein